jgi:hypothetical protein
MTEMELQMLSVASKVNWALTVGQNNIFSAVNLLTDVTKIKYPHFSLFSELIEVCQHSTEFHFPSIDDQLEKVRDEVKEAVTWGHPHWDCRSGSEHLAALTSSEQQVYILKNVVGSTKTILKSVYVKICLIVFLS